VDVRATDGSSNTADQTITVTVTDVAEGVTRSYLGSQGNASGHTVFTSSAIAFPTGVALIGVLGLGGSPGAPTGVTIGGNAMSLVGSAPVLSKTQNGMHLSVWKYSVTAGNHVIQVTHPAAVFSSAIRSYSLEGANAAETQTDVDNGFHASETNSITVPASGVGITFSSSQNATARATWAGATVDGTVTLVSGTACPFDSASNVTSGAKSPQITPAASDSNILSSVAFGQ
jgi:hypothetical protein